MYCNRCGTNFDHTYTNVCPNCGNVMDTTAFNQSQQTAQPQYGYQQPVNTAPDTSTTVLVWSIIGLAFSFDITILGIIFSCIARKKLKEYLACHNGIHNGKTKTGNILSTIGLISGIVMTVIYIILFVAYGSILAIGLSNYY